MIVSIPLRARACARVSVRPAAGSLRVTTYSLMPRAARA